MYWRTFNHLPPSESSFLFKEPDKEEELKASRKEDFIYVFLPDFTEMFHISELTGEYLWKPLKDSLKNKGVN